MAFTITTPGVGWQPIANTETVQKHPLGTVVTAVDPIYYGGEFIYLKGVASTVVGSFVTISMDDGTTALTVANCIGAVGVAMSINAAATSYGWYQISGKAVGKASALYADNGLVYVTATPGEVDDAVVAGDRIKNAIGASAVGTPSAGLAEFEINRPFADDASAA